jgi:hypothetical protein
MNSTAVRLGGLCGVGAAATVIPAYVVGSPELPNTPDKLASYYDKAEYFIGMNGLVPLAHLFLGIVFIAVLAAVLRSAMGPEPAVYMVLIGGAVFVALTAAGLAAEVAIPSVIANFGDLVAVEVVRPFLALSVWFYHYSQVGAAVVMFATAYAIWRTEVLPKWSAVLGVLGLLALAHTWIGLPAAYGTVAWVALTGLLLLAFPPVESAERPSTPIVEKPAEKATHVASAVVSPSAEEEPSAPTAPAADAPALKTEADTVVAPPPSEASAEEGST